MAKTRPKKTKLEVMVGKTPIEFPIQVKPEVTSRIIESDYGNKLLRINVDGREAMHFSLSSLKDDRDREWLCGVLTRYIEEIVTYERRSVVLKYQRALRVLTGM